MTVQVNVELVLENSAPDTLVDKQLGQAADEIKLNNTTDAKRLSDEMISISYRLIYGVG